MIRIRRFMIRMLVAALLVQNAVLFAGETPAAEAAGGHPALVHVSPADNAENVPANTNLVLTFDEKIRAGTGSASVTIRKTSDNTVVESFPIASSNRVTIGAGALQNQVIIDPTNNLIDGESYYVLIDEGAFRSDSGFNYPGISSATAWNFSVSAADTKAPAAVAMSPLGANAPVLGPLTIRFDEKVYASSGFITIRNTATGEAQSISVTSAGVRGSGTDSVTIALNEALEPNTRYEVTVSAGAFQDGAGNSFSGTSGWSFTTANNPMAIQRLEPSNNSQDADPRAELRLTLDRNVRITAGSNAAIRIKKTADNSSIDIPVNSGLVRTEGNVVIISPGTLAYGTSYYVLIDSDAFRDAATNQIAFQGISDAAVWTFTTKPGVDTERPFVEKYSPVPGGSFGSANGKLTLTFNEPVYPGSGSIVIRNAANDMTFASIPVTASNVTGGGTRQITIDPGAAFVQNTTYYVEIGSRAFRDAAGNTYAGIPSGDRNTWRFAVTEDTSAPSILSLSPENGSNSMRTDSQLTAIFNEPIAIPAGKATGSVFICRPGSADRISAVAAVDPNHPSKLVITPDQPLQPATAYYVEIAPGTVTDMAGNAFAGILNEYRWAFRTIGSDKSPPTLTKLEMAGAATILLTYNEPLDAGSVPFPANYYATVNDLPRTVIDVAIDGSTVRLALESGVVFGQSVKLSYSPGTKPLRDLSENAASGFANRQVEYAQDALLPRPVSGQVNGSEVTITFNENLASLHESAYSQFQVYEAGSGRSVIRASVSGRVLTLVVSGTFSEGKAVSVSYSAGSYPLRDRVGNAVPSFSHFYVRNALDNRPPVIQSVKASGTKVTLTYDEGLDPSSVPSKGQFSVVVGGSARAVQTVEIKNSQVMLTISQAVAAGQTITVSYVPGYPPIADMAGNAAAGFNGMSGTVEANTGQLGSAYIQGNTMTLVFQQPLNSSYVPSSSQFTVRYGNTLQSVYQVSVSGQIVTLTLYNPASAGDTVTVSYSKGTNGLMTASGEWVESFTQVTAVNLSAGGGGSILPTDYEKYADGGIMLRTSTAVTSTDTSAAGRAAIRYTLLAEKVLGAYQTARTSGTTPRLVFEIPATEMSGIVAVPLSALESARNQSQEASLLIVYGKMSQEIPLKAIDFKKTADMLNAGGAIGHLLLRLDNSSTAPTGTLLSDIVRSKGQLVGGPLYFEAAVTNGTVVRTLDRFEKYVTRTVELPTTADPLKTAVVRMDTATAKLGYVPTKITRSGSSTKVTFMHMQSGSYAVVRGGVEYTDMNAHWARNDVMLLANKYIVEGRTSALFAPTEPITRAEFAMFLARGLGLPGDSEAAYRFRDVNRASSFAPYIGAVVNASIVTGTPSGDFKPNSPITRQEMAVMMIRAIEAAEGEVTLSQSVQAYLQRFNDRNRIGGWATTAVAQAVYAGIIEGMQGGRFSPLSNASRAEAAVMVKRMLNYIGFADV